MTRKFILRPPQVRRPAPPAVAGQSSQPQRGTITISIHRLLTACSMAAVAAGSPAAIPDLRQRVLSLLARPAVEPPEAPQLQQPTREEEVADVLSQQRWLVRAEPTDAGLVPTLCVRQKKLLGRRLPVVIVLHGTGGSKDEMLPHLRRYAN
eukprot:COSAG05_NODE_178_length_14897_cov_619.335248_17_plen_150_part_01